MPVGIHSASTKTNEVGEYQLQNLPEGTYSVWCQASTSSYMEDHEWLSQGKTQIRTDRQQVTEVADLVVGPGGTIRARKNLSVSCAR